MKIDLIYHEAQTQSLTDYLTKLYIPRKTKHFLRMEKRVRVNGEIVPFHTLLKANDQLTITFNDDLYPQANILFSTKHEFEILYEDEHLIIVNKPIHLKTHPNEPTENDTLLNQVATYLRPQNCTPYVVHRLDMETSGCLLFAKNPVILPILSRMLEQKEIKRTYEALALGNITQKQMTINRPIGPNPHDKRKRQIDFKRGQKAITHVQVLEQLANTTRIQCILDTGRTHQIRVHLQSIGHPLKGDPLYQTNKAERLYLHARELTLIHPWTKQKIHTLAPTPF